jgi:hypothetical protein
MSAYYVLTQVAQDAAEPILDAALATPTPDAVDVQQAYVYLLRVVLLVEGAHPSAKIPLVEFPAAEPQRFVALAAPTPLAVDVQEEYVYLLRVVTRTPQLLFPKAKMPLVEFPVAAP